MGLLTERIMMLTKINTNEWIQKVHHEWAVPCGWWSDLETGEPKERDFAEVIALIHSEASEGLEGFRKDLADDHLPDRPMMEVELADVLIRLFDAAGGFGFHISTNGFDSRGHYTTYPQGITRLHFYVAQLGDVSGMSRPYWVARVFAVVRDMEQLFELDVAGALEAKHEYNKTRADHKLVNRRKDGGKKI